jgi:hypothetical protein
MIRDLALARMESSLSFWEGAGYIAFACVIACCFAEYLHVVKFRHREGSWWTERGGSAAALLLVIALAFELMTQFRTNAVSGEIIAQQNTDAAVTEERLLGERRLTARERWRLERVERAVLPRSLYVNWDSLIAALKTGKFSPINIALVGKSMEASSFAFDLMFAFSQNGLMGKFIDLSSVPSEAHAGMHSSSGAYVIIGAADGQGLAQMLFQKFQIGGGSMSADMLPSAWSAIPKDMNCLVVEENNWEMAPPSGQPGEGLDEHGAPDPAPH